MTTLKCILRSAFGACNLFVELLFCIKIAKQIAVIIVTEHVFYFKSDFHS